MSFAKHKHYTDQDRIMSHKCQWYINNCLCKMSLPVTAPPNEYFIWWVTSLWWILSRLYYIEICWSIDLPSKLYIYIFALFIVIIIIIFICSTRAIIYIYIDNGDCSTIYCCYCTMSVCNVVSVSVKYQLFDSLIDSFSSCIVYVVCVCIHICCSPTSFSINLSLGNW